MPALHSILETALYVDDLDRARAFYEDVMGLKAMFADQRLCAMDVAGRSVLLLFRRGGSTQTAVLPGGTIPPHDGSGPVHMAFAAAEEDLPTWERHLAVHNIAVEGRVRWPGGSTSLYFRDPDGHALEIATPGLWPTY
ncbi:VOC family protein [uncultured Alsobacter sp.]|uniref:VOC family protein n=1 Tax=uncultured Alsobacter sp. TaxID=1748258 RepID=UPI0025D2C72B|nr:VOC family protein [uncultured Alsobacter sp.]